MSGIVQQLPRREVIVEGAGVLVLPIAVAAPVTRGTVDAWLARTPTGGPAHGTVERRLVAEGQRIPSLRLYARDVRAQWPKGGRAYMVVAYAGEILARGELTLLLAAA